MALFNIPSVVDALEDLLDRERQAILTGNLDSIARQLAEKTRLLENLPTATADLAHIARLKAKADRNQELLIAVARGIKSATQRLKELNKPAAVLRTYDEGGASREIVAPKSSLERRA